MHQLAYQLINHKMMKDSHQKSLEFKFIKQLVFIGLKTCSSFLKLKHEILAPSFFFKWLPWTNQNAILPTRPKILVSWWWLTHIGISNWYILMRWPCTGKGGNRDARGRFLEFRLRRDSADPTRFRLPMVPPSVNIGTIEGSTQTTSCDLCPSKDNCHIQTWLGHQYFPFLMHTLY